MDERDKGNLLETEKERIVREQRRVRSYDKTHARNNSLIFTNTYMI